MTKLGNVILWMAITLISLGILLISGCSPNISETGYTIVTPAITPETSIGKSLTSTTLDTAQAASGITPTPIPPPLTRDANNPEYYYVDKANLENMGMAPRDITQK